MRKYKLSIIVLTAALSLSALSACGGKGVENLAATCESLRAKMLPLENIGLLKRNLYYDGDSVAMLLGWETRADNKKFILKSFPFMKSYTIESIQNGDHKKGINNLLVQTAINLFAATPNPIDISEEDKKTLEEAADPYKEVIEPKVVRVIGAQYSDEGCAGEDSRNNVDSQKQVFELYRDTQDAAKDSVGHLLGILLCERNGEIAGTKCDFEDYAEPYVEISNSQSDEEKEILAERGKKTESDSQGTAVSRGNSNVKPGQACSTLGQVINTSDYGQMTCKLVLLRRIGSQMWVRS